VLKTVIDRYLKIKRVPLYWHFCGT